MKLLPCLTILLLASAPVLAQNPQPTAPQNPTVPVAPPSTSTVPPEQIAPRNGNLSDTLSQQRGTVVPPHNVDPNMSVAPRTGVTGTMPVIPPPGSPGGNQSVVPK